jgi:general secretion pathway protein K
VIAALRSVASRVWAELVRPRGPTRHRFYRVGRRSRAGVALLMAITTILFMTVIVTEISYAATVRLQLAAHGRDEARAEHLARTGVQIYRLILVASKQLGNNSMLQSFSASMGINLGDALWQMVPMINTGFLRMMLVSGGEPDPDDFEGEEVEDGEEAPPPDPMEPSAPKLTDDQEEESRKSVGSERNFLDFDGDFAAELTDEDSRIYVGSIQATTYAELLENRTALELYGLMSGIDNDQFFYETNLDRWELIANLADWTDADGTRLYEGGGEDTLYNNLTSPYLPKNAAFDSLAEIRLVDGWNRDDVWERFGDKLTIYGAGKVNINTASRDVMFALLKAHLDPTPADAYVDDLLTKLDEYKALTNFTNVDTFISYLSSLGATVDANMKSGISTSSTVFRVNSVGVVGDASVTIEVVYDFSQDASGRLVYTRIE